LQWLRIPQESCFSSGGRRLGTISKQGNTMLRWLLVEAAQKAARCDPALRQDY
jgi:transposase